MVGIPPLEELWLAEAGLYALDEDIPGQRVTSFVNGLATGGLYTFGNNSPPSWPATAIAMDALQLAHQAPPAAVATESRLILSSQTVWGVDGADTSYIEDTLLPVWQVADLLLSKQQRARLAQSVPPLLARVTQAFDSAREDPPFAFALAYEGHQIALANGSSLNLDATEAFHSLEAADGYLSLSPDLSAPDPHLTYEAAELGMPPSPIVVSTIVRTAGNNGWWSVAPGPDPATSYFAMEVARATAQSFDEGSLRNQVQVWLQSLSKGGQSTDVLASTRTAFILALAQTLAVPFPSMVLSNLRPWLSSLLGGDLESRAALVVVSTMLGVRLSQEEKRDLEASPINARTMLDAYSSYVIGRALGDNSFEHAASHVASDLRRGPVFVDAPGVVRADLPSTVLGAIVTDLSPQQSLLAVQVFGPLGASRLVATEGSRSDTISPMSIYLGYLGARRSVDPFGLIGVLLSN
jgi:hypothetical protein